MSDDKLLGNAAVGRGDYNKAIECYKKAMQSSSVPDQAIHLNLSLCYLKLQQYHDAMLEANTAIALDSTNTKAWFRRGSAYRGLGQLDRALSDFMQADLVAGKQGNLEAKRMMEQIEKERDETFVQDKTKPTHSRQSSSFRSIPASPSIKSIPQTPMKEAPASTLPPVSVRNSPLLDGNTAIPSSTSTADLTGMAKQHDFKLEHGLKKVDLGIKLGLTDRNAGFNEPPKEVNSRLAMAFQDKTKDRGIETSPYSRRDLRKSLTRSPFLTQDPPSPSAETVKSIRDRHKQRYSFDASESSDLIIPRTLKDLKMMLGNGRHRVLALIDLPKFVEADMTMDLFMVLLTSTRDLHKEDSKVGKGVLENLRDCQRLDIILDFATAGELAAIQTLLNDFQKDAECFGQLLPSAIKAGF